MVRLHVKRGDESQFLFETSVKCEVDKVIEDVTNIYNGRLKISRICWELEELVKHGTALPHEMQGLTDEQIAELKLKDDWGDKCYPSDGWTINKDPMGRRNGKKPNERIREVIEKTMVESKELVSKKLVDTNTCLNMKMVSSALDMLRGCVLIAYPMGLPPHDPIRLELENAEDLTGTHASTEVLEIPRTTLWCCGKEMKRGKKIEDYLGPNEKTKVIVKLQKAGQGAPAREPCMTEQEQKAMMMQAYKRQEELKKLDEDADSTYLNSKWADPENLRREMHGIRDITFRPK